MGQTQVGCKSRSSIAPIGRFLLPAGGGGGPPATGRGISPGVLLLLAQPVPVNGACGSARGGSFATAPTTNLCSAGTAGPVNFWSELWMWACWGTDGGDNALCIAYPL